MQMAEMPEVSGLEVNSGTVERREMLRVSGIVMCDRREIVGNGSARLQPKDG
jgi:hypothetical protein